MFNNFCWKSAGIGVVVGLLISEVIPIIVFYAHKKSVENKLGEFAEGGEDEA